MYVLGYIVSFAFAALLTSIIMCVGRNRIRFDESGIVIMFGFNPVKIKNNMIKSIRLVEELPKVLFGVHARGFVIGKRRRGMFRVKKMTENGQRKVTALMFLDNARKSRCFIEIETVDGIFYVNLKKDELTEELFNEMQKTVQIVGESELAESSAKKYRIISLSIGLVALIGLVLYYVLKN